jgi:3-dehydroquinate synthase
MPKIRINLRERSYDVVTGSSMLRNLGYDITSLNLGRKCVIITDDKVGALYGGAVQKGLTAAGFIVGEITLPQGEDNKCLANVERCYHQMLSFGLDRKSFVVALGGGVIGDLSGYVAATYMRGIRFIQAPTTLLAAVDASIGGKTGVNLREGKNLVGAFHQPQAVFIDVDTLKTLDNRDILSGFAEMLKHALIRDRQLYMYLKENFGRILKHDARIMEHAIISSCKIKADIVEKDEREENIRALLNFGHTIGHAIESLSIEKGKSYRHGEAVSIGMAAALDLSAKLCFMEQSEAREIIDFISECGLPVACSGISHDEIIQRMRTDKKIIEGKLRLVLLKGIGEAFVAEDVEYDAVIEALKARCGNA